MLGKLATAGTVMMIAALMPLAAAAQKAARAGAGKATVTTTCKLGNLKVKTATTFATTSSTDYKNIPGTGIKFTQGTGSGCVVLQFSSEASTNDALILRAVLDGGTFIATPSDVLFSRGPSTRTAHAYNFVFRGVPPGTHTAVMQWRVETSTFANVWLRNTIVQFAP